MKNSKFKREMVGYGGPEVIQDTWQEIGKIGVDAGLCWIGDPCYILHKNEETSSKDIGENWFGFCDKMKDSVTRQFNYDLGHAGLGVCVSTGYGDGCYPVLAKFNSEGRIAEVKIKFIDEEM
jgi:hypothetical protein